MDSFQTQSVINESTFRALRKYLMPRKQKLFFFACIALFAVLLVISIITKYNSVIVVLALGIIVLTTEYFILLNRLVKISVNRLQETAHSKESLHETSLTDTGFKMINHSTNGAAIIDYNDIVRFVETEKFYALFTKANQFGIINRQTIDEANKKEALVTFLKERCKKIRW